jgi:hypothetical protein
MSIKDQYVPYDELLDLFGVQRVNALFRCLNQNNIKFILDKRNKPLVLRSALEGVSNAVEEEEPEAVVFTS